MTAVLLGAGAVLMLAVAAVLVGRRLVVVSVSGDSMAPTLHSGDRLLVRRVPGETVRVGEVVVVQESRPCRPGDDRSVDWMVKRVVAVPGDPTPSFLPSWERGPNGRVPPHRLVLLGDNAEWSRDSRHFGSVPADRVLGVVLRTVGGGPPRPAPAIRGEGEGAGAAPRDDR